MTLFKPDPVLVQQARVRKALEAWSQARREINDPDNLPPRLDEIVDLIRQVLDPIREDVRTDLHSLILEMDTLVFVEEPDEWVRAIEEKTHALQGALGKFQRIAEAAGYSENGSDGIDLPAGLRVAKERIADRLEALEKAILDLKDGVERVEQAQREDREAENVPSQTPLVQFVVDKLTVKLNLSLVKIHAPKVDISGLVRAVQAARTTVNLFLHDVSHLALKANHWLRTQAKEWLVPPAKALGETANRLVRTVRSFFTNEKPDPGKAEAQPAVPPLPQQADDADERPADFDLDLVHEMILRGEAPPAVWVPWITQLDFSCYEWQDNAEQRKRFRALRDLGPLSGLSALEGLVLANTQVSDLGPLSGLSALQTLVLDNTQVSDLGPLSGLSALQWLWLDNTPVSDLGPLSGLSVLQTLGLDNTQVSDLGPLAALSALQTLGLHNTQVSDLSPLSALSELQTLGLSGTQVSDLAPLKALPNLTDVYVARGRVGPLAVTLGRRGVVKLFPYKKYGFPRPTRRNPRGKRKPR